jgi:dihydroorotase
MKKLIRGGLVIDPSCGRNEIADILIDNGKIACVGPRAARAEADETIEVGGLVVAPGLVDMHTHLREPGFEDKETIASGAKAAARGGVTSLLCMANTNPPTDTPERFAGMLARIKKDACVNVYPAAAVSIGMRGAETTDVDALRALGAAALSDDGVPLQNARTMREALLLAKKYDMPILSHCEDADLVAGGVMNEGALAGELGFPGRPAIAEELAIARDGLLARDTGGRVHICHISARGSVEAVRRLKKLGVRITAETCPQYFSLTEEEVAKQGTAAKVNPPLRREADVRAIIDGLRDGTIDAIATDHAPHTAEEKALDMLHAPSGMVGLETSLALALTYLYHGEGFSLADVIRMMSTAPARILGIPAGTLAEGAAADIVIFDPESKWTVDASKFASKGRNTPFGGMKLTGRVRCTIAGGKTVYKK